VYVPDSSYAVEEVNSFYDILQSQLLKRPRKSHTILQGDFNATVGNNQHANFSENVGRYGLGTTNKRGWKVCAIKNLFITITLFKHSENRRISWISPDGQSKNQIDYIIADSSIIGLFKNCRSYHSPDIGSDHLLVRANLNISGPKFKKLRTLPRRYDVDKLKDRAIVETFQIRIGGYFEPLVALVETSDIDTMYTQFKEATNKATEEVIGRVKLKKVEGLPKKVETACKETRDVRIAMLNDANETNKERY